MKFIDKRNKEFRLTYLELMDGKIYQDNDGDLCVKTDGDKLLLLARGSGLSVHGRLYAPHEEETFVEVEVELHIIR